MPYLRALQAFQRFSTCCWVLSDSSAMAPTSLHGLSNRASVKLLSATGQLGDLFVLLGLFYFLMCAVLWGVCVCVCVCVCMCVCVCLCVYSAHRYQKTMADLQELKFQAAMSC